MTDPMALKLHSLPALKRSEGAAELSPRLGGGLAEADGAARKPGSFKVPRVADRLVIEHVAQSIWRRRRAHDPSDIARDRATRQRLLQHPADQPALVLDLQSEDVGQGLP